jgi:8-amino-7-oxononanoate synthase
MANLAIAAVLAARGDDVYEDRLNHASLLDAGLASGARFTRYRHGDPRALERLLIRAGDGRKLVLTDGVFSMDGDVAPLAELARLSAHHEAVLIVDDAHGFGVLGDEGRGSLEQAGLSIADVPVLMATLGKAVGVFGAFIAGSEALIETLIQRARPYVYTTALPPAVAAATRAALRVVQQESWRRDRLRAHVQRFRRECAALGLPLLRSETPIQPLVVGDEASAIAASEHLFERRLLVTAIRPPTVPRGSSRLRITLSAAHGEDDIDRLLAALATLDRSRWTT